MKNIKYTFLKQQGYLKSSLIFKFLNIFSIKYIWYRLFFFFWPFSEVKSD